MSRPQVCCAFCLIAPEPVLQLGTLEPQVWRRYDYPSEDIPPMQADRNTSGFVNLIACASDFGQQDHYRSAQASQAISITTIGARSAVQSADGSR